MHVIWIASYPKSGNTWMRFLLYHLAFGEDAGLDDLSARIPDIHRTPEVAPPAASGSPLGDTMFAKTHYVWSPAHPYAQQTAAAIHVIRHPKDVLVSSVDYVQFWKPTHLKARIARLFRSEAERRRRIVRSFIEHRGLPIFENAGFGTWASHADSWTQAPEIPVLSVKYEEMRADPVAGFRRVAEFCARFCDIPTDQAAVEHAVKQSEIGRLRKIERRDADAARETGARDTQLGADAADVRSGRTFFKGGRVGSTLEAFGPEFDEQFDRAMRGDAARFGYTVGEPG